MQRLSDSKDEVHPDEVVGYVGMARIAEQLADVRNDPVRPGNLTNAAINIEHEQRKSAIETRRATRNGTVHLFGHWVRFVGMFCLILCCSRGIGAVPDGFEVRCCQGLTPGLWCVSTTVC